MKLTLKTPKDFLDIPCDNYCITDTGEFSYSYQYVIEVFEKKMGRNIPQFVMKDLIAKI